MRLQRAVLRPGARVRLVGVHDPPLALRSCEEGLLLACLQDGTFECVLELWCGHGLLTGQRVVGARVPAAHLRPSGECGIHPWPACAPSTEPVEEGGGAAGASPSEDVALPVSAEGVGRLIASAVEMATRVEESGGMPEEMTEMGGTAFPDL
jgi:hypothetical protein